MTIEEFVDKLERVLPEGMVLLFRGVANGRSNSAWAFEAQRQNGSHFFTIVASELTAAHINKTKIELENFDTRMKAK